jgi:DNA replicative helicase MCM subunit Mcm2 (Cdc46/Mcm family)
MGLGNSGSGTSSAGLTVTAVRDAASGEWALEAGAVVLADGGVRRLSDVPMIRSLLAYGS